MTYIAQQPYKFTWFGDIHGPKPCKFMGFGDIHGPKPYKFIGFGDVGTDGRPHAEANSEVAAQNIRPRYNEASSYLSFRIGNEICNFSFVFWPVSGRTWPRDPFHRVGLEKWCRTHPQLTPETNLNAELGS